MSKSKNKHVVVSISGAPNSGKSSVAILLQEALSKLGVRANFIPMNPKELVPVEEAEIILGTKMKDAGYNLTVDILDGTRNHPADELRNYVENLDSTLMTAGAFTADTSQVEKEAARKAAVAIHCQKLSVPLALGVYYLKEVYPKRGFKETVE